MCVGMGTLMFRKTEKRLSGVIGEIMINPNYIDHKQILHKIAFTLEKLAWVNNCTDTVIQAFTIDEDLVRDLDYRRVHTK